MNSLTALFCDVDDFCQKFVPKWERIQMMKVFADGGYVSQKLNILSKFFLD